MSTDDTLASFSDRCGWVQVAGSGLMGPGPGGGYAMCAGTSMAAPLVTGQVALILSQYPDLERDRVCETIRHSAKKVEKAELKFGSVDFVSSLAWAKAEDAR